MSQVQHDSVSADSPTVTHKLIALPTDTAFQAKMTLPNLRAWLVSARAAGTFEAGHISCCPVSRYLQDIFTCRAFVVATHAVLDPEKQAQMFDLSREVCTYIDLVDSLIDSNGVRKTLSRAEAAYMIDDILTLYFPQRA